MTRRDAISRGRVVYRLTDPKELIDSEPTAKEQNMLTGELERLRDKTQALFTSAIKKTALAAVREWFSGGAFLQRDANKTIVMVEFDVATVHFPFMTMVQCACFNVSEAVDLDGTVLPRYRQIAEDLRRAAKLIDKACDERGTDTHPY